MNNLKHAASMKNPPKGYGSMVVGLEVAAYRNKRRRYWEGQGEDYESALRLAQKDVLAKYSEPR